MYLVAHKQQAEEDSPEQERHDKIHPAVNKTMVDETESRKAKYE